MLTHASIWNGIDSFASSLGYSPSGLAKKAGLDPTTFNKSKRISPDGKPRWPSTESIAKILNTTSTSISDFAAILDTKENGTQEKSYTIPTLDFSQTYKKNVFDDKGNPKHGAWKKTALPTVGQPNLYGIKISCDSMKPLYRKGDLLIIDPNKKVRKNDRAFIKLKKRRNLCADYKPQNRHRYSAPRPQSKT